MQYEMIKVEIEEILKCPALEGAMVRTLNLITIENHRNKRGGYTIVYIYDIYHIYVYTQHKECSGLGKDRKKKS